MLTIFPAQTPGEIALARELMTEYATALEFNLCFQNFDEEMTGLPGKYAPPNGRLLLALWDNRPAGVVALRPLSDQNASCEMKRLYVRPEFRGKAIGRALAERLIIEARQTGYESMRLDTVQGKMDTAIALYRELGFKEIAPYINNPMESAVYMELHLRSALRQPASETTGKPQ